jgi:hypothetical protein
MHAFLDWGFNPPRHYPTEEAQLEHVHRFRFLLTPEVSAMAHSKDLDERRAAEDFAQNPTPFANSPDVEFVEHSNCSAGRCLRYT